MKKKLFKLIPLILILVITTTILILKIKIDNTEKNKKPKEIIIEKQEIIEEEILEEDINISIPELKDNCDNDKCMKNNTFNNIKKYFLDNNYEEIKKDNSIYYKNTSNLIKLTLTNGNTNEEDNNQNKEEYDYILNRYTTIDDINKIINNQNINNYTGEPATNIAVLNYHFFYDKNTEKCNQSICLEISNFEQQLKYLKENNFKTVTIEEFRSWMYGEIELPKKSVLLTIDDGAMGTSKINGNKLIPLLEKYEINATLFLITGWWNKENYESNYLDIQSHTHLMHDENQCSSKSRGAELLCSTYEEILSDLQKSIERVDNNISFCFPFYLYDDKSIEALKTLDFKLAFIGGNKKANQNTNKYKIPRYIIYKTTSLKTFKNMVN